jgi:hypothetical protein
MECHDNAAGDAEAAGAIAGMIETYGTPADEGARVYLAFVDSRFTKTSGVYYSISEYALLGVIPGNMAIVRNVNARGAFGDPFVVSNHSFRPIHQARHAALAQVRDELIAIRFAITRQIDELDEQIAAAVTALPPVQQGAT